MIVKGKKVLPQKASLEEQIQKMSEESAERLAWAVGNAAFKIFRSRKFRRYLDFEGLEQTEQDRIFNELSVTALLLIIFTFEASDLESPPGLKDYLEQLKKEVIEAHIRIFKDLGVERKYRRLWRKLIDIRYREYQEERLKVREAGMELYSKEAPLKIEDLSEIQLTLPVETLAIGCFRHVTRGKSKPEDPLFPMIVRWLGDFYLDIRLIAEGRRLRWWQRLLLRSRRLWRRLRS